MNIQDLKKVNQSRMVKVGEVVQKQDNFIKLADTIVKGLDNIDPKQFKNVADSVKELSTQLKSLPNALDKLNAKDTQEMMDCMRGIQEAINNKDFSPSIDVKSPTVPKLDVAPIVKAIENLKEGKEEDKEVGVDLDDYRGIVIDDDADTMQYIGFMNTKGEWYIICNDLDDNKMTYKFGKSGFGEVWKSHVNLSYKMLDVAVAEVYSEVSA